MELQIKRLQSAARRRADGDKGFTLVELMVVVLVIAILLSIAIPTFLGARERSQDRAAQSNLRNALTAAKVSFSNQGDYSEAFADDLTAIEPNLDYTSATSDSEDLISVHVDSTNGLWAGAVWSKSGICWILRDGWIPGDDGSDATNRGTQYGQHTDPALCTGSDASSRTTLATDW